MASALVQLPPMIFYGRGPRAGDGDPQGACADAVAPRARGFRQFGLARLGAIPELLVDDPQVGRASVDELMDPAIPAFLPPSVLQP